MLKAQAALDESYGVTWPVLNYIEIGPVSVSTHSLGIVVGYLVGYWMYRRRARTRGQWSDVLDEAAVVGVLGVLVGSRLFWAIPRYLSDSPPTVSELFTPQFTNISLLGGVFGGVGLGYTWVRVRGHDPVNSLGLFGETMAVGFLIGRAGDLLIADHLGRRTTFALGYRMPEGAFPNGECLGVGDVCHHTALYEFVIVAVLVLGSFLVRRWRVREAVIAGYLLAGYGILRFVLVEPFRVTPRIFALTGSQWACLAMVIIGVAMVVRHRAFGEARPLLDSSDPRKL